MNPQESVAAILGFMFMVAATGPIVTFQLSLWLILCALFGALGKMWTGNVLWKIEI